MFDALIEKFLEIGEKRKGVTTLKPECEPAHRYLLVDRINGKVTQQEAAPEPRKHTAATIADLCEFAIRADDSTDPPKVKGNPVIWYNRSGATLLVDDDSRRDRVSVGLSYSPQIVKLAQWEKSTPQIHQKELILTLRTTFRDCLGPAGNLLEVIRRLKMRVNTQGESEIAHGKSSIGRSVEAEITGAGSLPEYFRLLVPVFAQPFAPWVKQIECALEPDAASNSFQVIPLPGQIEQAISLAEDEMLTEIIEELGDARHSVQVYRGVP